MLTIIWILGGLAAGLAAVELAPGESHRQVRWLCCLAGGLAGYALEPGETVLPLGPLMLSLVGMAALFALGSVIKSRLERRGTFKSQPAISYRQTP